MGKTRGIAALELNLSCPNLGTKIMVSQLDKATYRVVHAVRKATALPLIAKLTPNVTSIGLIARAATSAGADAISLVNTFIGMAVDVRAQRPRLANITGGLSGPAIRPLSVRMVWEAAHAVDVPIIGMGGIMNADDALEFILAGASAVAVGTGNFVNPKAAQEISHGIITYMRQKHIRDIRDLIGALHATQ